MERDLRLIRKKRAERDRANGIITGYSPTKEADDIVPEDDTTVPTEDMLMDQATEQPETSISVIQQATESTTEGVKEADEKAAESSSQEAITTGQGMPQGSDNSMGLAISMPPDVTAEAQDHPKSLEKKPTEATGEVEAPLELPDSGDLDFESMFNDTDLTAADDAMSFDLGFSTDPAVSQDILNDTSFENINMSNTDMTNLATTTNEDLDSLLPGVENYLNADTDFSSISVPAASSLPETTQGTVATTTGATTQNPAEATVGETSFDDNFFGLGDFDMGGTGGEDLGDGGLVDFDEFDWS